MQNIIFEQVIFFEIHDKLTKNYVLELHQWYSMRATCITSKVCQASIDCMLAKTIMTRSKFEIKNVLHFLMFIGSIINVLVP